MRIALLVIVGFALAGAQTGTPLTAADFAIQLGRTTASVISGAGTQSGVLHGTATLHKLIQNADGSLSGLYHLKGTIAVAGGAAQAFDTIVTLPTSFTSSGTTLAKRQITCSVLSLNIPPVTLTLLGLVVQLPQGLVLTINGNPLGGLLGQLLCSLASPSVLGNIGTALGDILSSINGLLSALGL